jgi:hypothetical protein
VNCLSAVVAALLVVAFTLFGCASPPTGPGWISLLDSATLDNFNRIGDANWRLADGVLSADKGGQPVAYLVSKTSYTDFELRAEFWVDANANSGVFIRCTDPQKISSLTGYEVQINDPRADGFGTGALVPAAKVSPRIYANGVWNLYEVTARGPRIIVKLNGSVTVDVEHSKFPGGPVALQYGSGVVRFRNVAIKPL